MVIDSSSKETNRYLTCLFIIPCRERGNYNYYNHYYFRQTSGERGTILRLAFQVKNCKGKT